MSEPSTDVEVSKVGKVRKPPNRITDCCSSLSSDDIPRLVKQYPCIAKFHPTVPDEHEKAHLPPPGKVALYEAYLTSSGLRLPFTPFYLRVLAYYKVGICQLHPFAVGKVIRFEMLSKALGKPPTLYMFRKTFLLSKTAGEVYTFLYRDRQFTPIETPGKLPGWRFEYFFVDSSFIPDNMRESICLGRRDYVSAEVSKMNKKVTEDMVDRRYYRRLEKNGITYFPIPLELEGVLAMVGISPSWNWKTIPVLRKKSTGERMISYF
jgi:hypothetical protein